MHEHVPHRSPREVTDINGKPYDVRSYRRGWTASQEERGSGWVTPLDRADLRGEPNEWYDGYSDHSQGNKRYHYRDCPICTK